MKIPGFRNEEERLSRLSTYNIIVTENDDRLDELTNLAAKLFEMPMVIITILDQSKQIFKSKFGLDLKETSRDISFCQFTIMEEDIFEVTDTHLDDRFKNNPLVLAAPYIRYYCGAPLTDKEGFALGSLGLLDRIPRELNQNQKNALRLLAHQIVDHFELNREKKELEKKKTELEALVQKKTQDIHLKLEELNRKDEKLNAATMELSGFMYKASHDLRGPLNTMQGLTHLAYNETKEDATRRYLHLLKKTQHKLDSVLSHLLTIVQVKNQDLNFAAADLKLLFENSFQKASQSYNDKNIKFQLQINRDTELKTDPYFLGVALEHVFHSSFQNNYSNSPLVSVSVFNQDKNIIEINIHDNGYGIPEEAKNNLFEMFFKSSAVGCGLHLYIAKIAIERLSGTISFTSDKNNGTTFSIILPCSS